MDRKCPREGGRLASGHAVPRELRLHAGCEPREEVMALDAGGAERVRRVDDLLRAELVRVARQALRGALHQAVVQHAAANDPGHAVHDLHVAPTLSMLIWALDASPHPSTI